ncbi:MAG: hypothetical protein CMC15_18765 [Flavobacteriaceae bacterium]|nr:hypothetical protein [Flavobacteriaceae bacterium]
MNYEDMSDFEINKTVMIAIDSKGDVESITQRKTKLRCINAVAMVKIKGCDEIVRFNPCNDPDDAWPIILEYGICITSPTVGRKKKIWSASWNEDGGRWSSGDIKHGDKNPLRAAMICFLMMKDAEK